MGSEEGWRGGGKEPSHEGRKEKFFEENVCALGREGGRSFSGG